MAFLVLFPLVPGAQTSDPDCDAITQTAARAADIYTRAASPRTDPVQVFDDSTLSCLEFITNFDIGFSLNIPTLGDVEAFLRKMAAQLLTRACSAATSQFNNAINTAVSDVKQPLNVLGNVGSTVQNAVGSKVDNSVRQAVGTITTPISGGGNSAGSTLRGAVNDATNRVVNLIK